mgnify:CR=1 FL=1
MLDDPRPEFGQRPGAVMFDQITEGEWFSDRDVQAIARWDDRALPAPGPVTQACAKTWRSREAETMEP